MFYICSKFESGAMSAERQQEQEPVYPTDADAREAVRMLLSDLEGWRGITTRRYRTASSTAAWPWSAAGQVAPMNSWVHQVELRLDRQAAGDRLRRMESWCGDWQIGMRVIEKIEPGTVRVAFDGPASPGPSSRISAASLCRWTKSSARCMPTRRPRMDLDALDALLEETFLALEAR